MWNGTFALLERSLRIDARSWAPHLTRLGLMAAIYISLCVIRLERAMIGAPGLQFFRAISTFDAVFMTLLGISFFSTSITEEKEEDTLGLMLMAGISSVGLLAGKSFGRLWQAILLVLVQYPFSLLAVTMGGVTGGQTWAMTVTLLAYMIFLSCLGLLCSTIAPRSQTAGIYMIGGLVLYFGLPAYAKNIAWLHATNRVFWTHELGLSPYWWSCIDRFGDVCVAIRMNTILTSGFNESAISLQVVSNLAAALICAILSWLLFGLATRSTSTESSSRGLVSSRAGFLRFPAGRTWDYPFVWKDFYFTAGGIWMLLVRCFFYIGLGMAIWLWEYSTGFNLSTARWAENYLTWIMFLLPVDAAFLVARSLQDEVRGQTIASLAMLPRSVHGTIYSKLAGAMMGWLPGPVIGVWVLVLSEVGKRNWSNMTNHGELWVIPLVFLFFSLVPHYAGVMALYVRWGAVPLGIGLTLGTYFGLGCIFLLIVYLTGRNPNGPGSPEFHLIMGSISVALLMLNIACHLAMLLRVQALSSK